MAVHNFGLETNANEIQVCEPFLSGSFYKNI